MALPPDKAQHLTLDPAASFAGAENRVRLKHS